MKPNTEHLVRSRESTLVNKMLCINSFISERNGVVFMKTYEYDFTEFCKANLKERNTNFKRIA